MVGTSLVDWVALGKGWALPLTAALSTIGYWVEIIKRSEKAAKPRFTLSQVGQPQCDSSTCAQSIDVTLTLLFSLLALEHCRLCFALKTLKSR